MRNQNDYDDNDDDEVIDYAKWNRKTRLADWRIFAVLMMFIGIFAASMFTGKEGASLFSALFGKIVSVQFVLALAFYTIWGINLFKVINCRGFRCVTTSGIWFMGYPIVLILLSRIVVTFEVWLHSRKTIKAAWAEVRSSVNLGRGLSIIIIIGLILLFMGICFSAQQEVAEKKKRIERL
ncbi:MAG: hypothetical protein IK055_04460 [Lachnospiraceae bacterium]|nr:hypothetical protein [Lachnospiraceae bacterium]